MFQCFLIGIFVLILCCDDGYALRNLNVVLTIEPKVVNRLDQATLHCSYDLGGANLYSVKWYRGSYEFYRYTPSEKPVSKVFPFGGITVDENKSNSTQVVLRDIEFNLAGKFTCEATTTEEPVSTGTDTQTMTVVQLPDFPPSISVGRSHPLDYGDTLRANCSSDASWPPPKLKFILNNMTVAISKPIIQLTWKAPELTKTDLSLELMLSDFHFNRGKLILECIAQVLDVYVQKAVVELESVWAPVPERVSAFNSAKSVSIFHEMVMPLGALLLFSLI